MTRDSIPPELRPIARELLAQRRAPSPEFEVQAHARIVGRVMTAEKRRRSAVQACACAAGGGVLLAAASISVAGLGPIGL